jgi:hypothetical protein
MSEENVGESKWREFEKFADRSASSNSSGASFTSSFYEKDWSIPWSIRSMDWSIR